MDQMQEMLELLRAMRADQIAARKAQVRYMKLVKISAVFFVCLIFAYILFAIIILRH